MTEFRHADDCPDPDDTKLDAVMGRLGDPLLRCPACRTFKVVRPESVTPELDEAVTPEAPTRPTNRYRCPEHIERGVTWKGTRCPDCVRERRDRQARRDRSRVERLTTH